MSSKSYPVFQYVFLIFTIILFIQFIIAVILHWNYLFYLYNRVEIYLWVILSVLYYLETYSKRIGVSARTVYLFMLSYISFVLFMGYLAYFVILSPFIKDVLFYARGFNFTLLYLIILLTTFSILVLGALSGFMMGDLVMPFFDKYFFRGAKSVINDNGTKAFVFVGRYNGFGFGSLLRMYVFVFTPNGELDPIGKGILAHELGHAKNRHNVILISMFTLVLSDALTAAYLHNLAQDLAILLMPFFMALSLIIFRACEIHADLAWHKVYGEESVNQLRETLKHFYGVDDPRKAPLNSRLTHPGKRDLVLRFGDALAPHAPWEFPLLAALFNATVVDFYLLLRISSFLPLVSRFLTLILTLFYVGSFVGSLVLVYLFGLVFKPLVRYFLTGSLTEDGLTNVSLLLSSIYLAASAASLLLASLWWTAVIAAFVITLVIVRHYVGKLKSSLFTVLSTMVIYLAVNLVLLLIMHVTVPIALHWFESLWHVR